MPNNSWIVSNKYECQPSPAGYEKAWDSKRIDSFLQSKNPASTKLSNMVRQGIPDELRGSLYCSILQIDKLEDYEKNFQMGIQRTHGAIVPENIVPPSFGGRPHRDSLALNKAALWVVEHVLCIIGHDFPSIEFCPFIPALAVMLSHHLRTPDDLLGAMVSILKKSITASSNSSSSKSGNANWAFFPMHRKDLKLMGRMFASLLSKHNSKLATHLESFDSTSSPNHQDPPWQSWFSDLFIDQLPQAMLWRMLDCFLLEGYVVLFRFGIALLQLHRNTLVSLKSPTECTNLFKMQNLKVPVNVFCDSASGVSITAADIEKAKAKKINAVSLEEIHEMQYKYQRGRPKLKDESTIVQELHWIALWSWIPPRFRLSDVELIFTTGEHGYNLNTMYEMTSARKPLILVLETMEGGIFGAFISTGWPEVGENPGFQGDGETFMFTLEPYAKMYSWVGLASADGGEGAVEVKAENSMFVSASRKQLLIGGGGGDFGLAINDTLTQGTTSTCLTFGNEPLTGKKAKSFECVSLEVFAFV